MKDQQVIVTREVLQRLTLDTEPWLSCDDCFDRMDEYVESVLTDPDHRDTAMQKHLAGCAACAEEADSLMDLIRAGNQRG